MILSFPRSSSLPRRGTPVRRRLGDGAFTLIELLTVIAIIGVLSAILIPTVSSARVSAKRAKTKVLFSQWAAAMEQFRQEYGYYPRVTDGNHLLTPTQFLAALTARDYRGTSLPLASLNGNTRAISFYTPGDAELLKDASGAALNEVTDVFGNSDIVILFDVDGNGVISGSELARAAVRRGNSVDGFGAGVTPSLADIPADGIRASIAIYSAGRGDSDADLIFSWK